MRNGENTEHPSSIVRGHTGGVLACSDLGCILAAEAARVGWMALVPARADGEAGWTDVACPEPIAQGE